MTPSDIITLLTTAASVALGAVCGIVGNRMSTIKDNSRWKIVFYMLGLLISLIAIAVTFIYWSDIRTSNTLKFITGFATLSGIGLIIITKVILDKKQIFKTSELTDIVNNFTAKADRNEIKLFGGDLNFFGMTPSQMDINEQYTKLRSIQFHRILILCEIPNDPIQIIRYGKILNDLTGVEFRFYNPQEADLRVRGRIIRVDGSIKLLMYKRIKEKTYHPIETDTADSNGALYSNIWDLVWNLATHPSQNELQSYINAFKGNH